MTSIAIHFMMCNLFIALCILMITAVKHLFKNYLSAQVIYRPLRDKGMEPCKK